MIVHVLTMLIQERLRDSQNPSKHKRARTSTSKHKQRPSEHHQVTAACTHPSARMSANERDQRQERARTSEHECKDKRMKGKVGICIRQGWAYVQWPRGQQQRVWAHTTTWTTRLVWARAGRHKHEEPSASGCNANQEASKRDWTEDKSEVGGMNERGEVRTQQGQ